MQGHQFQPSRQVQPPRQPGQQQPTGQPLQQSPQRPVQRATRQSRPQSQATQAAQQAAQRAEQGQQFRPLAPQQIPPATTSPFVDIYGSPEELTVFADLPGATADDVRLEGDERTLRIIARRMPQDEEAELTPVQQERMRRVERTIQLPPTSTSRRRRPPVRTGSAR